MNTAVNLCGLSRSDFEQLMESIGKKPFQGRQLYKWIYKNNVFDFTQMTDLGKELQKFLMKKYRVRIPLEIDSRKSSDGTTKFLLGLEDNEVIESVLIPDENSGRMTYCISSQVGCALNCKFCATGQLEFRRNLTVGEIVGQVMFIRKIFSHDAFDNLVFMGMGEPLLNIDNVLASIDILTDSLGFMLGAKRITVSTAGIVPGINKLTESGSKANLAISLNAADDNLRKRLMPIAKSYNLSDLMGAVKQWTEVRTRRVTFEYILIKNVNNGDEHAINLSKLIRGIPCKINLLAYNPIDGNKWESPASEDVDRFAKILYPRAPAVTVRQSRGGDIAAACGQLAGQKGYICE
ncbi:MAG: 23S rRNA (adenine(2503)-C(2))-methyltransferase RlmN [candidate division Zixibacteria bacterium]